MRITTRVRFTPRATQEKNTAGVVSIAWTRRRCDSPDCKSDRSDVARSHPALAVHPTRKPADSSVRFVTRSTDHNPTLSLVPINEIAGRLWNLHEFGGIAKRRRKLKRHRFRVGEHGPIRVKSLGNAAKFARIRLQTAAQASRATRLIEEENQRRSVAKPRRYPKRPFMRPALDANRSRLPKFWRDSVK